MHMQRMRSESRGHSRWGWLGVRVGRHGRSDTGKSSESGTYMGQPSSISEWLFVSNNLRIKEIQLEMGQRLEIQSQFQISERQARQIDGSFQKGKDKTDILLTNILED